MPFSLLEKDVYNDERSGLGTRPLKLCFSKHGKLEQAITDPTHCRPWTMDTGIPAGMTAFLAQQERGNRKKPGAPDKAYGLMRLHGLPPVAHG